MSAVVGERDRLLRGTVPRNIDPTAGKSLQLDVDPPAFHQNSAGIPTIGSAKFTATPVGFAGQVMWSITSGGKLTGNTPNERTLLFSDMTADAVTVTITIIYDGQAYIRTRTFYKVIDGKPGKDADPANLSPAALAAALEGRITEAQLYQDLRTRIDLVDGPDSNPSTVQGRIKKETDARVAALTKEVADRVTYVQQYTYSEQEIDQSLSIWAATVTSQYKTYADGVGGAAVSQSSADVRSYAYSKTDADAALTTMANTLRSEFATNNGVTTAYLNQYYYTQAQTNSAISSATQTLSTTVGQHTTSLQTQAQSLNGLSAQYTVKIDNNGRVSGFGLASTPVNGVAYSAFIINADAFSVGAPGVANKQMFTVGQVNGQVAMVLRGDMYADGDITARMLRIGTSDNIMPDPQFRDLGWWGRALTGTFAAVVNQWRDAGLNSPWLDGTSMTLGVNTGIITSNTKPFALTQGATYKLEIQVWPGANFSGQFSVYFLVPGSAFYGMGTPSIGPWSDQSLDVQFNQDSPKTLGNYTTTLTVPFNPQNSQGAIVIKQAITGGSIDIGSIRITRVVDQTLIGPGVVETKHMIIDKGGAIHSGQTGFDLGEGFWLEGANGDHGARLSLGSSGGPKILADPRRGIFGLYNFQIINPGLSTKTITGLFNIVGMNGVPNGTRQNLGGMTASMTNASGNITYAWSAENYAGTITLQANGADCNFWAQAPNNARCQGQVYCTATDSAGFSATGSFQIDVGFGSGVPI